MTAARTPSCRASRCSTEAKRLQALDDSGLFFVKDGDTAAALGTAAKVMEAEYTTSINIHAPMEPMNATAQLQGRYLAHLFRQPVRDALRRDRGRGCRESIPNSS